MTEKLKALPIEVYDVVDLSQERREFAGNTTGLYNAMVQYDPNGGVEHLGKLHGFHAIYGGITLSIGHSEMDEKDAKVLRDDILGENPQAYEAGNLLGIPNQILVRQGGVIEEMWCVPMEFIFWPDHFVNTPDVVFDSLDKLAERLHAYRTKASGFDQMGIIGNKYRDIGRPRALEHDKKRLGIHRPNIRNIVLEEGEENIPLPDNKASNQQA